MDTCDKHKKYRGLKAPDYECETCLQIFIKIGSQRPIRILCRRASLRHKDKSKYDRKQGKDE